MLPTCSSTLAYVYKYRAKATIKGAVQKIAVNVIAALLRRLRGRDNGRNETSLRVATIRRTTTDRCGHYLDVVVNTLITAAAAAAAAETAR